MLPENITKDKYNRLTFKNNTPLLIHGNGPAKKTFYISCISHLINKYNINEKTHSEIKEMLQFPNGWP